MFPDFLERIIILAKERGFRVLELGRVDDWPMVLLNRNENIYLPNLLVVSGIHGDEQAGPWGVVRFLEEVEDDLLCQSNLSIIPLVSPIEFFAGRRLDKSGNDPNRGFYDNKRTRAKQSEILIKNTDTIRPLASDGAISLHEDMGLFRGGMMFTYENTAPGEKTKKLLKIIQNEVGLCPDGKLVDDDGVTEEETILTGGLSINQHGDSFENFIFEKGISYVACTETPGKSDFDLRVKVNCELIKEFVK